MNRAGCCSLAAAVAGFLTFNATVVEALARESSISFPQEQVEREPSMQAGTKTEHGPRKTVTLSGKVSDDGKTLVSNKDGNAWIVSNPEALKGYEGRQVKVKGRTDAEKIEIQVLSVKILHTYNPTPEQP